MITLKILEDALSFIGAFVLKIPIVANVLDTFSNLTTELSYITHPEVLIDIFRLARLFLPTGTIVILFGLGCLMVAIQILTGLVYFLVHLGNII